MELYNSLTKKTELFEPVEKDSKEVMMYVCGITPYDSAHIGHARTFVSFDLLKRYLTKKGYRVFHIQNITDVDDKIIKRCKETGADPKILTTMNHERALELFERLNIIKANIYPKVTEHIGEIIEITKTLEQRHYAYPTTTGVYFDVSEFRNYGELSGQKIEEMHAGARIEPDETKQDAMDFALWKSSKGEILEFESPWGLGRPGWHIECSAMSLKYSKGRTLDIHGGARDLIFPHHENEIAQSEAANGKQFAKYWAHTGFLTVNGEKMSKSLGNFVTLEDALNRFSTNAVRAFFLAAHYRAPLDYSEDALESMEETVERIFNSLGLIREAAGVKTQVKDEEFRNQTKSHIKQFYANLDRDLNTPSALSELFGLLRVANTQVTKTEPDRSELKKVQDAIEEMLWVLGLVEPLPSLGGKEKELLDLVAELKSKTEESEAEQILKYIIKMRNDARQTKDFKRSDLIRDKLKNIGIVIEDSKSGVRWKLI
ncbi:cysteine--tRNA ligase [Candidatus Micrarchaeota archaeon]|nr:cysteine--tRNA ligase [Candidatus Micrarchaeota archaeon]